MTYHVNKLPSHVLCNSTYCNTRAVFLPRYISRKNTDVASYPVNRGQNMFSLLNGQGLKHQP